MKRILQITVISLAAIFLMPDGLSGQTTTTSTTATKEKKEQEALLKATEEQKKAQEELKKATQEQKKALDEQEKALEEAFFRGYDPDRPTIVLRSQQGGSNYYGSRSRNSTTLDFSRNVTDNTATKEYTFDVEKEMKMVSLSISGSCKSGEISISIIMPGNKEYSTVMIDEVGSMSWKKTFEITEEDAKSKTGVWKFKVITTKATGNFRLSLSGS